jgi:hypothetical protein
MEPVIFFEAVDKVVRRQLEILFRLINSFLGDKEIDIEYSDGEAHFSHISIEHNLIIHMTLDQNGHDYAMDGIRITVEKLFNDTQSAAFVYLTDDEDLFRILSPQLIDALEDACDERNNLKVHFPSHVEKPPANFDEIWRELTQQANESLKFIVKEQLIDMGNAYKESKNEASVLVFQNSIYRVFINCVRMESGYLQYLLAYSHIFKRRRMGYEASFSLSQSDAFALIPDEVKLALQQVLNEEEEDTYNGYDEEEEDDDEDE